MNGGGATPLANSAYGNTNGRANGNAHHLEGDPSSAGNSTGSQPNGKHAHTSAPGSDDGAALPGEHSNQSAGSTPHSPGSAPAHLRKKPKEWATLVLKKVFIALVHTIVVLYTYLTLPVYYALQKPWLRRKDAGLTRASQEDPADPHSPWVSTFASKYSYVLDHVESIDDLLNNVGAYFNLDRNALGQRRVLAEHPVMAADGKTPLRIDGRPVKKRELSEYEWVSYEDMIARRVHLARGLYLAGVRQRERVVILCDTCAEYMMMQLAIANAGAVQVNVFSTLGDSGIAHAVRETQARVIFTSFELLPKVRAIVEAFELDVDKVIYIPARCENVSAEERAEAQRLLSPVRAVQFLSYVELERDGRVNGQQVAAQCKPIHKDEVAFISKCLPLVDSLTH